MTAALIAVTVVAVAAIAGLVVITLRSRLAPGPSLATRTVVVNTRRPDDQSIRGILVGQYADRITLRDATYLHGSGDQPVGGVVHIPIESVAWLQEVESPTQGSE